MIEKIRALPQGLKASIAFFAASVVTKAIAYITTPVYTRLLTTEEYGKLNVYLTWENIFGIIAMFSLMNGVFNNGMVDYPKERSKYSFSMLGLSNLITIIFGILLIIVYPFVKDIVKIDFPLLLLMLMIFLTQPAYSFWTARQRYELKYKKPLIFTIILAIISPVVSIGLILIKGGNNLYNRLFGSEVPLIIIYIGFCIYLAYINNFKIERKYWKAAFLFNLPLIPHYLSSLLLASSDKIMISNLVGNDATAYYSVAYSVAAIALIVWNAVNVSLVPFTYENCKIENYKRINDITLPIITFFSLVCIIVIMLAPEVIRVIATKNYLEAIYVIPPVVGGVFFQVQYYIYANIVYYYKRPKYVMFASVTATILNILLNYVFIKKYGYIAAGYTTLICYMVQSVIDYYAMKKVVGKNIYNMKFIITLSIFVISVSLVGSFLYKTILVRYIIIIGILLFLFVKRKTVFGIMKGLKES